MPCCRWWNASQRLPRRPIDAGLGERFVAYDPRPAVEDPDVILRAVERQVGRRGASADWHAALPRADGRSALAARRVVAARRSAAHLTRREPKMRIDPQIVLRGGRDGRRRRSARSLCGPSDRQSCCRPSGLPQRTPLPFAGQPAARSTRREPEMRIEPQIALTGGVGGRRRLSASGCGCVIACAVGADTRKRRAAEQIGVARRVAAHSTRSEL